MRTGGTSRGKREAAPSPRAAADRIHSAAIRLLRSVRTRDGSTGLSPARLSALSVLVFRGPCSLKSLAGAEGVKPPTMSRIVDALAGAGLALRRDSSRDGREWRIEATGKGRRVLMRAREERVAFLAARLSGLRAEELSTLLEAAEVIERVVNAEAADRRSRTR